MSECLRPNDLRADGLAEPTIGIVVQWGCYVNYVLESVRKPPECC